MAYTPPAYTPSGNLFGGTTPTTSYTYGNLAPTTSSYNVWGSHGSPLGNPYLIAGPTYTPGSGAPLVPQPIAPPVAPPTQGGGDSGPIPDWVDPNSAESQAQSYGDLQSWLDRPPSLTEGVSTLLGAPLFTPVVDLMYGINPYTQQSYSWYDGSTDDFGYVGSDATLSGQDYSAAVAAYDLDFEAGMTDLGQDEYIAQYMSERENDDPNNPAQDVPGWWEGIWGSSQDPIAIQAQQAIATTNANAAAAIQAEAEAAQAEAQAEAAAQQQQLDLMYNMYTGYTNQQLGLVTDSISAQIGDINTQIAANQGQTTTELAQLSALQNELYGATNNQIDSLNAQLTNLTDTSNNQYSQLTAAQQTQYNDILSQLETVEGDLTQQINDSYTGPYNNTDFLDMANPQPGAYTLNPVTGQYVGQSSVSFNNNPYADSDLSSLGEQLGTGPGTSFTPSDSGGTVTVSTDTGSTSYDTTDLGGGQHSVDVSSDGEGPDSDVGWEDPNGGSSGSSDSNDGKVICTAMNEDYGFGAYRNAIWLKYAAINYADKPEMEAGYHALCLPMLRIRKKWYGKPTYAWLKHVAKHRTADLKAEMYGKKRDRIGQAWRFILEPLCYYVGKRLNNGDK